MTTVGGALGGLIPARRTGMSRGPADSRVGESTKAGLTTPGQPRLSDGAQPYPEWLGQYAVRTLSRDSGRVADESLPEAAGGSGCDVIASLPK